MFLTEEELNQKGFKSFGKNVLISDKASIYGANNISIGNDVRIDDFCTLSGNITLKNNIHIAEGTSIGSMSLVNRSTLPWKVYYGIPARPQRDRDKKILECEQEFIASK